MVSAANLRFPDVLDEMGEALRHRGPDGRAVLVHPNARIGTERLRIIDLHERADQPFASPDGSVWLEANGEIYNAPELRPRYSDYPFRSHSDVETILPLYLEHGTDAIPMLDGMFGLAIWDNRTRTLILALYIEPDWLAQSEKPLSVSRHPAFFTRAASRCRRSGSGCQARAGSQLRPRLCRCRRAWLR